MRDPAVSPVNLRYMDSALALAFSALGSTAPNPAVGCILVKNGIVVGQGATAPGGRPHAETQALDDAGFNARGATAYVTLEPCAHTGKTPPCASALIEANIATCFVACRDPFAEVNGRGVDMLRDAGITVIEGVRKLAAEALNLGFFTTLKSGQALEVTDPRHRLADASLGLKSGQTRAELLREAAQSGLTRVRIQSIDETQR